MGAVVSFRPMCRPGAENPIGVRHAYKLVRREYRDLTGFHGDLMCCRRCGHIFERPEGY